jgi:CRISPR-associated protein Cmr4
MSTRLVLVHALSPLHAGTGQAVGAIDLPIARERPTGIPLVPGSSLKGALRARSDATAEITRAVFGPVTADSSEHAGGVQLSDAHLVLLPVRSVAGTYAWVTSPYLLRRLARDAAEAGLGLPSSVPAPATVKDCTVLGPTLTVQTGGGAAGGAASRRVVLEDLDFAATLVTDAQAPLRKVADELGKRLFPDGTTDAEDWRRSLVNRLCLVHDDVMALLLDTATEVAARVRLDPDTKTVATGALWYEEALPAESVLAGLAVAYGVKAAGKRSEHGAKDLLDHIDSLTREGMVQLGGKANTGRGSCLVRIAGGRP